VGGVETPPPYSPDLNPCDYDGIARIKRPNKGMRFADENELHAAYDRVIEEINLNNEATGIRHLPKRWAMVTQTGENILYSLLIIVFPFLPTSYFLTVLLFH
jgi:hypothetical protein